MGSFLWKGLFIVLKCFYSFSQLSIDILWKIIWRWISLGYLLFKAFRKELKRKSVNETKKYFNSLCNWNLLQFCNCSDPHPTLESESNHFNLNFPWWFIRQSACDFVSTPSNSMEYPQQQQTNQLKIHTIQFNSNKLLIRVLAWKVPSFQYFFILFHFQVSASNIINQNNIICIFFARAKRAWRIDPLRIKICRNKKRQREKHFPIYSNNNKSSRIPRFEWLCLQLYIAAVNWSKCIVILLHRWLLSPSLLILCCVMFSYCEKKWF